MSAVVGRRNNWLLSPGKLPEQFLIKIDKKTELLSSTSHREGRAEVWDGFGGGEEEES